MYCPGGSTQSAPMGCGVHSIAPSCTNSSSGCWLKPCPHLQSPRSARAHLTSPCLHLSRRGSGVHMRPGPAARDPPAPPSLERAPMSDRATFVHPPSHLITAPALQSEGSLTLLCLPPRNCGQEPAPPSLWWPRL